MKSMRKMWNRCVWVVAMGVTMTGGIVMADDFTWNTGTSGVWNLSAHWTGGAGFPEDGDDATQDDSFSSHIQVAGDERCDNFTGNGASPNDRYTLVEAGNELRVDLDFQRVSEATGNYIVKLDDGSSGSETTVNVLHDVTGITFTKSSSSLGQSADYVTINASHMFETTLELGQHATVTVANDEISSTQGDSWTIGNHSTLDLKYANIQNVAMTLGEITASIGPRTTVTVGSVGDDGGSGNTDDWIIRGGVDVTIDSATGSGNFIGFDSLDAEVDMFGDATLTVDGHIEVYDWILWDDSAVTASATGVASIQDGRWRTNDDSTVTADSISGGEWILRDDSTVDANDIDGGSWNVNSGATLDVAALLDPATLLANGTVTCDDLSAADVIWDMSMGTSATVDVADVAWHTGDHPQGGTPPGGFSKLNYSNTAGTYTVDHDLIIMGELIQANGPTDTLNINIGVSDTQKANFLAAPSTVRIDGSGDTQFLDFDTEGVKLTMQETTNGNSALEAVGPDYDLSTGGPLFTDSPCVKRWGELKVLNGTTAGAELQLNDGYISTPISGSENSDILDAVYVKNLTIETGATIDADGIIPAGVGLYFTGAVIVGATTCTTFTSSPCSDPFEDAVPVKLTPTLFGDFDADGDGDETVDTDRFIDAWCTCQRKTIPDPDYDFLTDGDCDGDVDEDDLLKYETNYGTGSPPNISAFDSLSSCDPSTVCP